MTPNRLKIFTVFVIALFILGFLFLAWTTIQKDTSLNSSSADVKNAVCGNADTNSNGVLDVVDYNEMRKLLNKSCLDSASQTFCGPKDMNRDGKIDVKDLSIFGTKYNLPNCGN